MALSAWKKLERTPRYQRLKVRLKRLVGKELRIASDIDVAVSADGGWQYDPSRLDDFSIVYSLGVGDDIRFDLSLIERFGCSVFAFDPTPTARDFVDIVDPPANFRLFEWAVGAVDGTMTLYPRARSDGSLSEVMYSLEPDESSRDRAINVPSYTVPSIARKLGHARIDLLKMDIEGAEYDVISGLLDSNLRPTQLLVEFHHRFASNGLRRTTDTIARLRDAGYRIMAVCPETGREVAFLFQG